MSIYTPVNEREQLGLIALNKKINGVREMVGGLQKNAFKFLVERT